MTANPRSPGQALEFFPGSQAELIDAVTRDIRQCRRRLLYFVDGNLLSIAKRRPDLHSILATNATCCADGTSTTRYVRRTTRTRIERITGPSTFEEILALSSKHGWRHYFYGGAPATLERLTERLRREHPGVSIAGAYAPPFRSTGAREESRVLAEINASQPDIVWVALGAPKQERWVSEHARLLDAPVIATVGAAFDFYAGTRRWCPMALRRLHLEWLYRTLTGGTRTARRNLRAVADAAVTLALAELGMEPVKCRVGR